MTLNIDKIEETFIIFIAGEMSIKDLEQWLYITPEVEDFLGEIAYLEIISFDFRQPGANYEFCKLISGYVSQAKYNNWEIKQLLKSLLDGSQDAVLVFNHLYWKYRDSYEFLHNLAISDVLGIDDIPTLKDKNLWDEKEFLLQRKKLDEYVEPLMEEIETILEALETGKIKLLNENEYSITPEVSKRLESLHQKQVEVINKKFSQYEISQQSARPQKSWRKFWQK